MAEPGFYTVEEMIFGGHQDPGHNAIEAPGLAPLPYRDLRTQVRYVVRTLNALGFHRNDRIAVIIPPGPDTAVIIVSVMAGFTCVPLSPDLTLADYRAQLAQLKVRGVIVRHDHESPAVPAAELLSLYVIRLVPVQDKAGSFELRPGFPSCTTEPEFAVSSDISHIFLTSGTTARPKAVPVAQKQSFITRQRQVQRLQITGNDRCLHILPFHHGMGIGIPLLATLLAGGTVICTTDFIPSDFPILLEKFRPTFFIAGPAHHQGILREMRKVPSSRMKTTSLRFILSSSAMLPPETRDSLETMLGVPVIEQYATTETGLISFNIPPRKGSVGIPVIDHLLIRDGNGRIAGPWEQGEILVRGETVFCGYEDAPEENSASFTDGWFRTGDLGYLDNEGYLFLTGRKKELINKGGEKISPEEIDAILKSHPGIRDAMTFGIPDPVLGEDVAVMIVPANDHLTEADLRLFLVDRLVRFKIPGKIWFVDDIPKTPTGKPWRLAGTERFS